MTKSGKRAIALRPQVARANLPATTRDLLVRSALGGAGRSHWWPKMNLAWRVHVVN